MSVNTSSSFIFCQRVQFNMTRSKESLCITLWVFMTRSQASMCHWARASPLILNPYQSEHLSMVIMMMWFDRIRRSIQAKLIGNQLVDEMTIEASKISLYQEKPLNHVSVCISWELAQFVARDYPHLQYYYESSYNYKAANNNGETLAMGRAFRGKMWGLICGEHRLLASQWFEVQTETHLSIYVKIYKCG